MLRLGGSAANLSALAVARETAKRRRGPDDEHQRWRVLISADAHSSVLNALRVREILDRMSDG